MLCADDNNPMERKKTLMQEKEKNRSGVLEEARSKFNSQVIDWP